MAQEIQSVTATQEELNTQESIIRSGYGAAAEAFLRIRDQELWRYQGSPYTRFVDYMREVWDETDPNRHIRVLEGASALRTKVSDYPDTQILAAHSSTLSLDEKPRIWNIIHSQKQRVTATMVKQAYEMASALPPETLAEVESYADLEWASGLQALSPALLNLVNIHAMDSLLQDNNLRTAVQGLCDKYPAEFTVLASTGYLQVDDVAIAANQLQTSHVNRALNLLDGYTIRKALAPVDKQEKLAIIEGKDGSLFAIAGSLNDEEKQRLRFKLQQLIGEFD